MNYDNNYYNNNTRVQCAGTFEILYYYCNNWHIKNDYNNIILYSTVYSYIIIIILLTHSRPYPFLFLINSYNNIILCTYVRDRRTSFFFLGTRILLFSSSLFVLCKVMTRCIHSRGKYNNIIIRAIPYRIKRIRKHSNEQRVEC